MDTIRGFVPEERAYRLHHYDDESQHSHADKSAERPSDDIGKDVCHNDK